MTKDIFISLTHWGREKMAAISQTTFSNAFFLITGARIYARTRSRIQYGGRQMRRVNTVLFLLFYQCFADTNYAMR